MPNKPYTLLLFLLFFKPALAQKTDSIADQKIYHNSSIELGIIASVDGNLPYWMEAEQWGRFKQNNADALYSIITHESSIKLKNKTRFFAGGQASLTAYGQIDLRPITHYIGFENDKISAHFGRAIESFSLNESPLSLGSLVYGSNARPIPKFVLKTNDWQNVPFINSDKVQFKAYFAHGWLGPNQFQRNSYLHQKYFFGKLSLFSKKLTLLGGIHHNAQWGGANLQNGEDEFLPSSWSDYMRILIGASGDDNALLTDQNNALGNHLGNFEFQTSYDFGTFILSSNLQFLWEDSSGLRPTNWVDGKFGFQIDLKKKSILNSLIFERVNTTDQDAVKLIDDGAGGTYLEPDSFFNNSVYRSGWTYKGRVIGSPLFLLVDPFTQDGAVVNNMVKAIRVGASGSFKNLTYHLIYTEFENEGTYTARVNPPFDLKSLDLRVDYKQSENLEFFTRINYQEGNWSSQRNLGIQVGITSHLKY